ncbi:hypothetical protein J4216_00240 [Candidatus Woesearchaeota archaeon]|nr:hypothetical protein [Candidatus Woesearchaeota archaeon]
MKDDIFTTRKGIYQLDTDTGLFVRKDGNSTPKFFLGSLDPNFLLLISEGKRLSLEGIVPYYRDGVLLTNLLDGENVGFTSEFVVGYRPFGIVCDASDIEIRSGSIIFSDKFRSMFESERVKTEIGSKIDEVYRQLKDEERNYRFSR